MRERHSYPFDLEMARRAIAAQAFIDQHHLQDALGAELRATMPECRDEYICWADDASYAHDLASKIPKEFGSREQLEPLAREFVAGSRRKFLLQAMEKVVADYKAYQLKPPPGIVEELDEEPDPPPPPADWVPSYLDPEDCGQPDHAAPAAPIEIKSAEDVPDCVRRAAQRRAGH